MEGTFCTIDFETANPSRGSVCALGLVRMSYDGTLLATDGGLVQPPPGLDTFAPGNMRVHHITAAKVAAANAPTWPRVLPWLVRFVGDDLLLAHNAPFERSVLRAASVAHGLSDPALRVACTVRMARALLPHLPNHKLPTVAAELGLDNFDHHDATADALACARIGAALLARTPAGTTMEQLAGALDPASRRS